jgi:hypothetical protein
MRATKYADKVGDHLLPTVKNIGRRLKRLAARRQGRFCLAIPGQTISLQRLGALPIMVPDAYTTA